MKKILNGQNIDMGVCYYPEHWDCSAWENDLDRMLKAGIKTVRIAEFTWSIIEKTEGCFDFSLFDSFLDLAHKKGINVIFCTPTATPPAWLTEAYPEVLNCNVDGIKYQHGMRRHYNYNSPIYRKYCTLITEAFAEHYARHPAIIGWQIDNELNCETSEFYSESDTNAFREWLKTKYKTLDALNDAWGTVVWSQVYTAWTEIHVPRKTIHNTYNPHLHLDYFRFISDSMRDFTKIQTDILKQYIKKDDFITTNGIFGNSDNHRLNRECLDFFTYDSYPDFAYCLEMWNPDDKLKDRNATWRLAETRSVSPVFGIMEQQSGPCGWTTRMEAPAPRPGQITLWTMQSVAHGADYISYFRWRTATVGIEIYWHGILDYSGRDNRRLKEITELSKSFENLKPVAGSLFNAKVAVLKDYDNIFDTQTDRWHKRMDSQSGSAIFETCHITHTPFDFVYFESETDKNAMVEKLKKYQVVIYPHGLILTKERAEILEEYVKQGGKLVLGARTGQKDIHGRCVQEYMPGLMANLAGIDIPEYSLVAPDDMPVTTTVNGKKVELSVFMDGIETVKAEKIGEYDNGPFKGFATLTRNNVEKGECWYFAGAFSQDAVKLILELTGTLSPYDDKLTLDDDIELEVRSKDGKDYFFVLNYSREEKEIDVKFDAVNLMDMSCVKGKYVMKPYQAMVLTAM